MALVCATLVTSSQTVMETTRKKASDAFATAAHLTGTVTSSSISVCAMQDLQLLIAVTWDVPTTALEMASVSWDLVNARMASQAWIAVKNSAKTIAMAMAIAVSADVCAPTHSSLVQLARNVLLDMVVQAAL